MKINKETIQAMIEKYIDKREWDITKKAYDKKFTSDYPDGRLVVYDKNSLEYITTNPSVRLPFKDGWKPIIAEIVHDCRNTYIRLTFDRKNLIPIIYQIDAERQYPIKFSADEGLGEMFKNAITIKIEKYKEIMAEE